MTRKTIDIFLVTYEGLDHDFNLIREGIVRGFETREDAFKYAMELNLKSISTHSNMIFKVEFKRYRKALKDQLLAPISDDRLKWILR